MIGPINRSNGQATPGVSKSQLAGNPGENHETGLSLPDRVEVGEVLTADQVLLQQITFYESGKSIPADYLACGSWKFNLTLGLGVWQRVLSPENTEEGYVDFITDAIQKTGENQEKGSSTKIVGSTRAKMVDETGKTSYRYSLINPDKPGTFIYYQLFLDKNGVEESQKVWLKAPKTDQLLLLKRPMQGISDQWVYVIDPFNKLIFSPGLDSAELPLPGVVRFGLRSLRPQLLTAREIAAVVKEMKEDN